MLSINSDEQGPNSSLSIHGTYDGASQPSADKQVTEYMLDPKQNDDPEAYTSAARPSFEEIEYDKLYMSEGTWNKTAYLVLFPIWLEKRLQRFDDPIVEWCQKLRGKVWYYLSMLCTALVAIEIGIAVPFILFIMGLDGLATQFTYLALVSALVSQVPKRFLWRFRPYMVYRAHFLRKDTTSSFPSRAVTCAAIYSFAIIWAYLYLTSSGDEVAIRVEWWMPVLFLLAILFSSLGRINLGVHYPSDCVAGLVQGVIICGIGMGLWKAVFLGCQSCRTMQCYTNDSDSAISYATLNNISPVAIVIAVLICTIIPVISVMKPIDFWSKCDRTYGLLLPGVAFQILFLCPHGHYGSIPPPPAGVQWYSVAFGCGMAGLGTILCMKIKSKRSIVVYFVLFIVYSLSLVLWRLSGL